MMTKHFLPHIGEMVNKVLKYLYLEFGIIIAYIIQNISIFSLPTILCIVANYWNECLG